MDQEPLKVFTVLLHYYNRFVLLANFLEPVQVRPDPEYVSKNNLWGTAVAFPATKATESKKLKSTIPTHTVFLCLACFPMITNESGCSSKSLLYESSEDQWSEILQDALLMPIQNVSGNTASNTTDCYSHGYMNNNFKLVSLPYFFILFFI